uniref:TRF2/HOY1 PH-like domain-containing protein n=1 Tax=Ananas comosus var. bracteatus TaxID=296719 RepID=A0A6V7QAI7_ANACO|nr:unnamed protein product [Ananas comosus var. bracteatus]
MVHLPNLGKLRPDSELLLKAAVAAAAETERMGVKVEIEDPLDEEYGPFDKRSKFASPQQEWSPGVAVVSSEAMPYNLLNEPSPLGLRLRKSPSLVDLIQMRLSQANGEPEKTKESRPTGGGLASEKLKASNFPASLLKIGDWERVSKYENDLVAKCYFAKHKLVWEVLDGGLKSKIEIQWPEITALKATCPENGPGTLDVVLAKQPLFFRETNPQPRKHTLWQSTSDFTGGQASIHRRHFLQCPQGLLNKHFEKLIQCDPRLCLLSRQPDIILENPYFELKSSVGEDPVELKFHHFDSMNEGHPLQIQRVQEMKPSIVAQTHSPISVTDSQVSEENASGETDAPQSSGSQFKVPGFWPSMSISEFMNHLEHHISGPINLGHQPLHEDLLNKEKLEHLAQYLLNDSQSSPTADEKSLMSRVNSFCCLIQKDPTTIQNLQIAAANSETAGADGNYDDKSDKKPVRTFAASDGGTNGVSGFKQPGSISRKDSVGELLMHLPRIASLPQILHRYVAGNPYKYCSPHFAPLKIQNLHFPP